jgi:hypothetical protein
MVGIHHHLLKSTTGEMLTILKSELTMVTICDEEW